MGMMRTFLTAFILCLLPVAGYASGQCYTPEELRAEQLLRLHSELMVITVTCRQSSEGEDLVSRYTEFTKTNINALHGAEQIMAHFYQARYGGDGIEKLDKLRTQLGNEYGQQIADISAPAFCEQRRDKVMRFATAHPEQIDTELDNMVVNQKSYIQPCSNTGQLP